LDGQRGGDAARTGLTVARMGLRRERGSEQSRDHVERKDATRLTIMHASMPLSPMS
jgi:hypothetical protein